MEKEGKRQTVRWASDNLEQNEKEFEDLLRDIEENEAE